MQDPSLHDEQLESEIKLVGELVLAASQYDSALSEAEVDEVLGLGAAGGAGPAAEAAAAPADGRAGAEAAVAPADDGTEGEAGTAAGSGPHDLPAAADGR